MLVVHKWLKEYLGDALPSVDKIEELLTFHAFEIEGSEVVEGQDVIDIDVLPNRSSDCLSHRGIARELATLLAVELAKDPLRGEANLTPRADTLSLQIDDTTACRRFAGAVMTGLAVKDSPDWLKERLIAIGQRPINNIVDATNYVMFSLGQPLHAYDADKLEQKDGSWHLGARMAKEGEKVTTLTGEEYELDPSIQLIVGANDTPLGIAGIKGGKQAEVDEKTTRVIVEAANFDPTLTRKASQRLRLQTDASKRFENDLPPELVPYALVEVVKLLIDIGGGTLQGYIDSYPTALNNSEVQVTLVHLNKLLGVSLGSEEVAGTLKRLGFALKQDGETFFVTAPFERTDIKIAEDVIEEVGRVYGYEHVASVVPEKAELAEINARQYYSEKIRATLIDRCFSEVITSSFRKKDEIKLLNALASDKGCLRSSLVKNIIEVLDKNAPNMELLGLSDIRVFEIGTVFTRENGTVAEHVSVALGARTRKQSYSQKDDAVLKDAVAALEEVLDTKIECVSANGVTEFSLTKLLDGLPAPSAYEPHQVGEEIQYKPFSSYPYVTRDIALWVPERVAAKEVEEILDTTVGKLRVRTTLFDEFKKDGRVSYAFRLVFQSNERTLTDSEVNELMTKVSTAVKEKGWEVR